MTDVKTEFYKEKDQTKAVSLNLDIKDDIVIIDIIGELTTFNSEFFQKRVATLYTLNMTKYIFNMKKTSYVSSTGIGAFVQILNNIKKINPSSEMVLCDVKNSVYEVFQLLGFSTFFNKFDNLDTALQHFQKDEKPIFPSILSCPACGHKLRASKSGKFRCPSCKNVVAIDSNGKIFKE